MGKYFLLISIRSEKRGSLKNTALKSQLDKTLQSYLYIPDITWKPGFKLGSGQNTFLQRTYSYILPLKTC